MSELRLYGIKNCDTIKKARRYLDDKNQAFIFHDYRIDGIDNTLLQRFETALGWQALLNTRGTTWRKLPQEVRDMTNNADAAIALMLENPAIIKRPILENAQGELLLGFKVEQYDAFLQK